MGKTGGSQLTNTFRYSSAHISAFTLFVLFEGTFQSVSGIPFTVFKNNRVVTRNHNRMKVLTYAYRTGGSLLHPPPPYFANVLIFLPSFGVQCAMMRLDL